MSAEWHNPDIAPKTSWSNKKRFLSKRKIPATPSVLRDSKLESDFKTKTNFYNSHLAASFFPFKNVGILREFKYRFDESSKCFSINEDDFFYIYTFLW